MDIMSKAITEKCKTELGIDVDYRIFVDDMAIHTQEDDDTNIEDIIKIVEDVFSTFGFALGHGKDKDGIMKLSDNIIDDYNNSQLRGIEKVRDFKYLGTRLCAKMEDTKKRCIEELKINI